MNASKNTQEAAEKVGILGIIVDAKDEGATNFYEGFGFVRLTGYADGQDKPETPIELESEVF